VPVASVERLEMLGAALDLLDEGVAVLDTHTLVVYWNDAASALTGHRRMNLLSRPCPADLYRVSDDHRCSGDACECGVGSPIAAKDYSGPRYSGQIYIQRSILGDPSSGSEPAEAGRGVLVAMRHHLGHTLPAMLRNVAIRDTLGKRIGTVLLFRPAEALDALPHGESLDGLGLARSQAEIEGRLETAFHEWKANQTPFGLLWITIDQAAQMRRTHGRDACEAMLRTVEHRLSQGLRPSEVIGRWGSDEFLVLSHERNAQMLTEHGDHLAGLTRTADFRWWGDRVSLTASIGAAQAAEGDTLSRLMLEAQQAMHASLYAGGNHVAQAKGESCSR